MQRTIECPSGLTGTISHLRTEDAKCLADDRAIRTGKAADAILKACWKETDSPGPYSFNGSGLLDWGHVLASDRIYTILMIRVCTHGTSEELDMRCANCKKKFVWDLPLDKLTVYPVPDASREKIRARDNKFPGTTRDGAELNFRLVTGHDQREGAKIAQESGSDIMQAMLLQRIIDVAGVESRDLEAWVGDLSLGDAQYLIDQFDEADGGIDTGFEVYCPRCGLEWEVDLPLDLQRMFVPKRRVRRKRRGIKVVSRDDDDDDGTEGPASTVSSPTSKKTSSET